MHGLYAIIDPEVCSREPAHVAQEVLRGGCALLQLRDKRSTDAEFVRLASVLARLCREHAVPFVLNDRFWLVPQVGAQGAHLGQSDRPLPEARQCLGGGYSLGLSTHNLDQARAAARDGADLIGFGPVFATATKPDADAVVGIEGLRAVVECVSIPVVAIGGISLERAPVVARTGVPLAAAISALCAADCPRTAAQQLHAALGGG
jgi:thiamine-phosphate pyrophosphorylase